MKTNLIGERVVVAKDISELTSFDGVPAFFGETGSILKERVGIYGKSFTVLLDSGKKTELFEDELYFPNSVDGYNQKCFI